MAGDAASWRGPMWMATSSLFFAGMGLLVKVVSESLPAGQVVFWRSAVATACLIPWALRDPGVWRPKAWGPLVARSLSGVLSMLCYFTAIGRLRLGDAVMISYASPLVVALLSPTILGERPSRGLWLGLLLGFGGVALVAGPSFSGDPVGVAAAVATAVFAGTAYVYVRVASRTERSDTIVLWFSALSALLFFPAAVAAPVPTTLWPALVGVGVLGVGGQLTMTRAYAVGEAATVAMWMYLTPVLAYLLGLGLLDEAVSWRGLVGTVLVALAGAVARR